MLTTPDRKGWYVSVKSKDGRCIEDIITQKVCKTIEEAEKRIAELEAQIEKMKNCFNCAKGDWNNRVKCIKSGCVNKDKWEIKEK